MNIEHKASKAAASFVWTATSFVWSDAPHETMRELLRLALEWESGYWHERAVPWLGALCLEPEGSLRAAAQRAVERKAAGQRPRQQLTRWLQGKEIR